MSFVADYPGAIVYPAHPTNWRDVESIPICIVLHTPEEPADNVPSTPRFFAEPDRDASTTYFAAFVGVIYQCVPEDRMAIANGVIGKPYPAGADPRHSLNKQSFSIEIEGYAQSIAETMRVGGPQWRALVALIQHRARARRIPMTRVRIIGHFEVANNRLDPGRHFPWAALIRDVQGGLPVPVSDDAEKRILEGQGELLKAIGALGKKVDDANVFVIETLTLISSDRVDEAEKRLRDLFAFSGRAWPQ